MLKRGQWLQNLSCIVLPDATSFGCAKDRPQKYAVAIDDHANLVEVGRPDCFALWKPPSGSVSGS